jgi:hypothetical protein
MKRPLFTIACLAVAPVAVVLGFVGSARASNAPPLSPPVDAPAHAALGGSSGVPICSSGSDPNGVLQECSVDAVGDTCAAAYGPSTCVAMTCWDQAGVHKRDCAVCLPNALQLVDPRCAAGADAPCGDDGTASCKMRGGGSVGAYAPDCSVDDAYFASLVCSDPSNDTGGAGTASGGDQSGGSSGTQERQCFNWSTGSPQACPTGGCGASVAGFGAGHGLAGPGACFAAVACMMMLRKRRRPRALSGA